ncbi:hypothetical protein ASC66_16395 [Leifsonia sp. Root4]|uniref:YihY/virulence factor BrkB family protein n=1 Tax=Leifsonia sp. Root4 TaxID=1736525 RepID=UPI0006F23BDE|nr:YihY/virulence factor BrkB family protein [Leifsonia sp. Root4]KQW04038.1 hypothetical protein ASC66_16395 [Leifsonia sp. Root4]
MTENESKPARWFDTPLRWWNTALALVMELKPVRAFTRYAESNAPLLAAGMSYQALFAVFAGVYLGFTLAGLWLAANPAVWDALIDLINGFIPGLLSTDGSDDALVDPDDIVQPLTLGISGLIALIGLVFTAIGWIGSTRGAVRQIFRLPGDSTFFLLLQLKDLGLALALGIGLVIAAVVSVFSTSALGLLAESVGASTDSAAFGLLSQSLGVLIIFVIDTLTLVVLFRVVAGIRIRAGILWRGALLGGGAMTALQLLGGTLLGGAANNPLLASFTALIGVLIWFNLISQLILIVAAWVATGVDDARSAITASVSMRSLAERRVLRAQARVQKAQQELASATTIAAALTPEHPSTDGAGQPGDPGRSV